MDLASLTYIIGEPLNSVLKSEYMANISYLNNYFGLNTDNNENLYFKLDNNGNFILKKLSFIVNSSSNSNIIQFPLILLISIKNINIDNFKINFNTRLPSRNNNSFILKNKDTNVTQNNASLLPSNNKKKKKKGELLYEIEITGKLYNTSNKFEKIIDNI